MSMVEKIKAVENAVESPVAEIDFDRFRWTAHVRLMIAAALAEAEKVDAEWKRAREAWLVLDDNASHNQALTYDQRLAAHDCEVAARCVLRQFFGGGEGEG